MSRFTDKRHLLILVGLICQGCSFDEDKIIPWLFPLIYAGLWFACVAAQQEQRRWSQSLEAVLVAGGLLLAYAIGPLVGYNRLVFVGNGLVVYQALRLTAPLGMRERMYTVAVAVIQLAIGSQVLVDWKFLVMLLASIVLIPGALFELEAEKFRKVAGRGGLGPSPREYFYLTILMVVFFLMVPRSQMIQNITPSTGGAGANAEQDNLDMSDTSPELGERLIMRVEGEGVEYLKVQAFDNFDGRIWSGTSYIVIRKRSPAPVAKLPDNAKRRRIRVLYPPVLGNHLPTDGYVIQAAIITGMHQTVFVADSGGLSVNYPYKNKVDYEYWSTPSLTTEVMSSKNRRRYLGQPSEREHSFDKQPDPSPEVKTLLAKLVGGEKDPYKQALLIQRYLRDTFTYSTTVYQLNLEAPVDDFLFVQQAGHCERFASALTYLLRVQGIPARVVVGYVATEFNEMGGFYNVRERNAHAWTEGWFPNRGWVTLDATPLGNGIPKEKRSWATTLTEMIAYTYYSKVVEFDTSDQNQVLSLAGDLGAWTAVALVRYAPPVIVVVVLLAFGWHFLPRGWRWLLNRQRPLTRQAARREASHFYGRMLTELARQRWLRRPSQTPLEFQSELQTGGYPGLTDAQEITTTFCAVRYGEAELQPADRVRLRDAIDRLRRLRRFKRGKPA
jgi:transglutaminase-like putative cysteine protease